MMFRRPPPPSHPRLTSPCAFWHITRLVGAVRYASSPPGGSSPGAGGMPLPGPGGMPNIEQMMKMAQELSEKTKAMKQQGGSAPGAAGSGGKPLPSQEEMAKMFQMFMGSQPPMPGTPSASTAEGASLPASPGVPRAPSLRGTIPEPMNLYAGAADAQASPARGNDGASDGTSSSSRPFASRTGFGQWAEKGIGSQISTMRKLLLMQQVMLQGEQMKRAANGVPKPSWYERLLSFNIGVFSRFADWQERRLLKMQGGTAPPSGGVSPSSPAAGGGMASPPLRASLSSKGGAAAAKNAASDLPGKEDNGGKASLDPEIEALFAELKTMRESRNNFRDETQTKRAELSKATTETLRLKNVESDLRKRLSAAEQESRLLKSEALELKSKQEDSKRQLNDVSALRAELHRLKQTSAPAMAEASDKAIQDLSGKLTAAEAEMVRLRRKVQRSRRQNPLLQFLHLINDLIGQPLTAAATSSVLTHSPEDAIFFSVPSSVLSLSSGETEPAEALRGRYDKHVEAMWQQSSASLGSREALVAACSLAIIRTVPCADYDAQVTLSTEAQAKTFTAAASSLGWRVVPNAAAVPNFAVTLSATANALTQSSDRIRRPGPFASLLALHHFFTVQETTSRSSGTGGQSVGRDVSQLPGTLSTCLRGITAIVPVVSLALVDDASRCRVETERCRSSSPGGQAANVGETQVSLKLFVDGCLAVRSEAQDSRSALANQDSATERLRTEQLTRFNDRARRVAAHFRFPSNNATAVSPSPAATGVASPAASAERGDGESSVIAEGQWSALCAPAERSAWDRLLTDATQPLDLQVAAALDVALISAVKWAVVVREGFGHDSS